MTLITITNLTIGYRGPNLLDDVSCQIGKDQRIGLLGRNGAGKTTFMRLIQGEETPDAGEISFSPGTTTALLQQDVPVGVEMTVREVVRQGCKPAAGQEEEWRLDQDADRTLSQMKLDGEASFDALSSGMKRRVLLAKTLVTQPDILLLDEPTNHLDVEAIDWLEQFLLKWRGTLLFVTHDRMFLQKLANRIFEIDRGRLFDWSCDYETFLQRKEQALAAEEKQNALFDKRLAEEERWIRQGIKARRTRNEGRVRALKKMRDEHRARRKAVGAVKLRIQEGQRSGNLVTGAKDISFSYGDHVILRSFSTTITRGDKVGIIGPNGAGKTTLLKILLGELQPNSGQVRTGTNLQVAYFDQLRAQLDEEQTVQENVGEGNDTIEFHGQRQHVIGYLQNFLFTPERARTLVKFLSGGERNRILLAKLFTKPANVLVLDEPTNDLDMETLELLEEQVSAFTGTALVVSHDRAFLNNVVTSTIVFDDGQVGEFVGGYDDWIRQRAPREPATSPSPPTKKKQEASSPAATPATKKKLSYMQQRELDALPEKIDSLEQQIDQLHAAMAQPEFYQQPGDVIAKTQAELKSLDDELATALDRWESLEDQS